MQLMNCYCIPLQSHALFGLWIRSWTRALLFCLTHKLQLYMLCMQYSIKSIPWVTELFFWCVDQRKDESSASLPFVGAIQQSPINSPHKGPVTRKMFPFYDVIMVTLIWEVMVGLIWIPQRLRVVRHGELWGLIVGEVWGNHPFILFDL